MDEIKWVEIFKEDTITYIRVFCSLVVTFRIIGIVFKSFRQADAMVYFSKLLMHSILVIMILIYYTYAEKGLESIDVLTGFTLLFSAVEITDCFFMFIREWLSKNLYNSLYSRENQIASKREEDEFYEVVSKLLDIQVRLQPGKVDPCICKNIVEIHKWSRDVRLHNINRIIERGTEDGNNFDWYMNKFLKSEPVKQIIAHENNNINQPVILNYYKCVELREILEKTTDCKWIYLKELDKFEENKEIEQYVNSRNKIKRFESKFNGLGGELIDREVNIRKKMGY